MKKRECDYPHFVIGALQNTLLFTEIIYALEGPGIPGIIKKENIQFEIFQIQSLPVKLHRFHGVQIWVLCDLMLLNSRCRIPGWYRVQSSHQTTLVVKGGLTGSYWTLWPFNPHVLRHSILLPPHYSMLHILTLRETGIILCSEIHQELQYSQNSPFLYVLLIYVE